MPLRPVLSDQYTPQHVAIVMDGNRRWAHRRAMPAAFGHAAGAKIVRSIVQACADRHIQYLTLFAFSTENWQRPADEVSSLMGLFVQYLEKEAEDMAANGIRLVIVGDTSRFEARLQTLLRQVQDRTAENTRITLSVAVNYGGRWDIIQAMRAWQANNPGATDEAITEEALKPHLSMAYAPDPDLIIRTGGDSRISNFLVWQAAYSELFFTDTLWPEFTPKGLDEAIAWFSNRERRFGANSAASQTKSA